MTDIEMAEEIGERVRNARESLGMTVKELARILRVYSYEINDVEEGNMPGFAFIRAIQLADALGMTLSELAGR